MNLEYKQMFNGLSAEQQKKLLKTKKHFLFESIKQHVNICKTINNSTMTDVEKNRCKIIAQIFKKDLEKNDIFIIEAGAFGFIMLEYYKPRSNFDCAISFMDSQTMFETLLNEWYDCLITDLMKEKQIKNVDIDVFYQKLSETEKNKLLQSKNNFLKKARKKATFIKY